MKYEHKHLAMDVKEDGSVDGYTILCSALDKGWEIVRVDSAVFRKNSSAVFVYLLRRREDPT